MAATRTLLAILVALCVGLQIAQAIDVKAVFFDNTKQDGDSASYQVTVTNACTSCQGFGFRLTNSWESYVLAAPVGSGNTGNYSLTIYDGSFCSGKTATLTTLWGDFPGTLKDSVDSWKVCPPGKTP